MKKMGVAALHLDEVQDSGRYKTSDSVEVFSKRFRNLMQDREWPVCLIMTATPEGKTLINHDPTLTRRLRPVEMKPMSFKNDSIVLRKALAELFKTAGILDAGLLAQDEFIKILIHASVGRVRCCNGNGHRGKSGNALMRKAVKSTWAFFAGRLFGEDGLR